jgi:hypothetical protein
MRVSGAAFLRQKANVDVGQASRLLRHESPGETRILAQTEVR